jgi:hypothetical protein
MSNPWDRPPPPQFSDDDVDTTYAGVGRVLSVWETVETELSYIFAIFKGKMWEIEAYDEYYARGKTTRGRLQTVERAANDYFIKAPSQEAEGAFCRVIKLATGFADRRHEVAHGIVRPFQSVGHVIPGAKPPMDGRLRFCLVPPHYRRGWHTDGMPEYTYTSVELAEIEKRLWDCRSEVSRFRWDYLFTPSPPPPS